MRNPLEDYMYRLSYGDEDLDAGDTIKAMQCAWQLSRSGEEPRYRELVDADVELFRKAGEDDPEQVAYENLVAFAVWKEEHPMKNGWLSFLEEYRKEKDLEQADILKPRPSATELLRGAFGKRR